MVISRGTRVYLRTLAPRDLDLLAAWVDDPFLERMVGSEFLNTYKHVWDKTPAFYEAVLTDPTQVVLVVEANRAGTKPVGRRAPLQHPPAGGVRVPGDDHHRRASNAAGISASKQVNSSRTMAWTCWDCGASRPKCTSTTSSA